MNIIYSILKGIVAGIVAWFIIPFIEPLQGDIRLGIALIVACLILLVAVVSFRRGAASSSSGDATKSKPNTGSRVASGIKAKGNITVRVDGVETSDRGQSEVGSNIEAGKNASVDVKNIKDNS